MKGTSSWVERVLHGTVQLGSSRTNVCLYNALKPCLGVPLLSGQAFLVLNSSNVASQGQPGKGINLIKSLKLNGQDFVLAKVVKASKSNCFEIRTAVPRIRF